MLNVVMSLQDINGSYSKNVATTIVSVKKNTKSDVSFHIFHDETLSNENKARLVETCHRLESNIIFYNINIDIECIESTKYLSKGALYRLDIANQLKKEKKALYLDADVIVQLDIKELFNIDMNDKSILAVRDSGVSSKSWMYSRKRNIPTELDKYFNSGVLLFNLEFIRTKHRLLEECLDVLKKYPREFFADQAALNYVLQNECIFLDKKYNLFPTIENDSIRRKCIWHFAGGAKPWKTRKFHIDKLYWKYLRETPWGDDVEKLFSLYSETVIPIEDALLSYPIGKRKDFIRNLIYRLIVELKKLFKMFY